MSYHLNGNLQNSFKVKLAPTLLEQIFQTLPQQVHHHHVVTLAIFSLLIANEVQVRHAG
jgi:hypothetical protein